MIARRRKRPRVTSSSFRTLGWLIRREAAFTILVGAADAERRSRIAVKFVKISTRDAEWSARAALKLDQARRYYP